MYTSIILILSLLGFSTIMAAVPVARFDDFKMYQITINDEQQLREFQKLGDHLSIFYLSEIGAAGHSYDIVVDPHDQEKLENILHDHELSYVMVSDNLQDLLEKRSGSILNPNMDWKQYHSVADIYKWLDHLVARHPYVVIPFIIGYSYEGRPIKAVQISHKPGNKAIFIESNIHAIEWISSAASTCFLNKLLLAKDPNLRHMVTNYDWIFVPVLNPDGLEYTHNVNPLWRKNRRPNGFSNSSGLCYGVDMNRNFNSNWNVAGHNVNVPCDHWYGGSQPDSEPEVQALQKFIKSFPQGYIRMYLAMHSFGNYLLLPYGHTTQELPPNYEQMMRISKGFADAAKVKYGTEFLYGPSGKLLYPVSGSSKDWAYTKMNIPYTATLELRDKGKYGFFLPANQIIEVCEEVTDGYIGMIKAAEAEGLFN